MDPPVVGRDAELAQAWACLDAGGSVVVTGQAGTGKSTVVAAVAAKAHHAGWSVLRCAPAQSEAKLPFLALIDLLAGVDPAELARLEAPWLTALEQVRTCDTATGDRAQQLAIRLATLHLVRQLAEQGNTLLVVDDLQWVDPASAEVLAFVARRCDRLPARMLAAERTADPGASQLCPPPVRALPLPPLPLRAVDELLAAHTGAALPHATVQRIHAASGGNPLFALEIARALARSDGTATADQPLPVPERLRALVGERLAGLSRSARRTLLLASIAARPTTGLLQRAGRSRVTADLAAAARLDIVAPPDGEVVRFRHPMFGAVLYAEATAGQRRYAHHRLAETVADPIERARHRAQAVTGPDARLADELARAARVARRRGAPGAAAELGLSAAARTPHGDVAAQRRLRAARDALAAGHCEQARAAAEAVLAEASSRAQRVRAWLIVLDAASQALPHADSLVSQALAAAGRDAGLQAEVRVRAAAKAWVEGRLEEALAQARRCGELARDAGRPGTVVQALCLQVSSELALGHRSAAESLARLAALEDADVPIYQGLRHLRARLHLVHDRVDAARDELRPLLARAEREGRVEDLAGLLFNLAEVELRAGRCPAATQAARRGLALVEDADLSPGPALATAALAEAAAGDPALARAMARRGVAASDADGDRMFLLRNLHALGAAALAAGELEEAADASHRLAALEAGMAPATLDPALFRWHADLAEALVLARRLEEAAEVIEHAGTVARRLDRRSVQACLARSRAWHHLARREPDAAAAELRAAAPALRHLPLEYGRACYVLGVAERRQRRRAAAREAFEEALRTFDAAGAAPWSERVRHELARAAPPSAASAPAGLTSTERRIAGLVSTGATNQQVATAMSLSVKTVEAYLTRIYRKLRVRSRSELAGTVAAELVR